MEETTLLSDIPFRPDPSELMQELRIRKGSAYAQEFLRLLEQAQECARPKVLYRLGFIDHKAGTAVTIAGYTFNSRILRVNLDTAQRAFAYVATCGAELETWSRGFGDMLYSFWADAIKESALRAALQHLYTHLEERYELRQAANMHPGSLEDWPLEEQKTLFALLGDTEASAGVRLTGSCLMLPAKSVSGLRFPLGETFESCQLCPRPVCPSRRAPYDPGLYERKYRLNGPITVNT